MTIALGRGLSERLTLPGRSHSAETVSAHSVQLAVPGWTLLSAGLLPVLLSGAWLAAGAMQPPSYSPVRQTVSVLAGYGGAHRWIVTIALYVVGVGYFATAAGFRAVGTLPRVGLVLSGVAAIAVASFPEPVHGTSTAHVVWTGIGAIALAVWPVLVARPGSVARAAVGGRVSMVAAAVSIVLLIWMAIETRDGPALGLAERMSSFLQTCWPFVVALALSRRKQVCVE